MSSVCIDVRESTERQPRLDSKHIGRVVFAEV
jgi:hypothetical protein